MHLYIYNLLILLTQYQLGSIFIYRKNCTLNKKQEFSTHIISFYHDYPQCVKTTYFIDNKCGTGIFYQ